jgi:transcriptional regulator with XRE-family HTH domain
MARTKFSELRDTVVAKPGAVERLAGLRAETLEEIRLYELRHGEAISQAELAGRLDVTQGAISKLEHSDDVRVSTLRQYLEALGARLELVAVFDDEDRRVPSASTLRFALVTPSSFARSGSTSECRTRSQTVVWRGRASRW